MNQQIINRRLTLVDYEDGATSDEDDEINMKKIQFVHFRSEEECDEFVDYIHSLNLKFSHKCCSNKGCGVILDDHENQDINKIKKSFKKNRIHKEILREDECDICYEIKPLINNCLQCNHPFCIDCLQKINNLNCPYCRTRMFPL